MNLSKQSKQLMLFFTKKKHLNFNHINNKTKDILQELFNEFNNSYNYIKKMSPFKANIKKILNTNDITTPKNFNSKSFPQQIRNHINENIMSEITYKFSLYKREVRVYFILENEHIEHSLDVYNKYVEVIAMWLYILNLYASTDCANTIQIYLYLTSLEKKLPNSNIYILDENNVNTAFTTTCPKDSEIVIFRKEEWLKVLVHETFHNFGLDYSMMNNSQMNNCILNIFDVNSQVNSYEAYTEFWAEIINALFCSFFSLKNKHDYQEFLSNAEFYINFERTFSFFQLTKTLRFMGLTYKDLYSKTEQSRIKRDNLYKEKTNVLAYYVLKTILINNFQGFLNWCKTNNFSLLNFNKTPRTLNDLCKFIEKNYKTKSMLEGVKESEIFLSKLNSNNQNMKFILSNMRMSICELG
jgi:hypothetical protein